MLGAVWKSSCWTGQLATLHSCAAVCAAVCSAFVSLFELSQLPAPFVNHAYTLATAQDTPMYQVHNAARLIDITHAMYTLASAQICLANFKLA